MKLTFEVKRTDRYRLKNNAYFSVIFGTIQNEVCKFRSKNNFRVEKCA